MKEDYQKSFKKSNLFFLPKPVPFNRQSYQKQKGPETSSQSLFRLPNKFRKIPLLVISYLTKSDDVIKTIVELFQKLHLQIYASQFMTSQIIPLPLSFYIWKVWRWREKIQNFEYLENEKSFFAEIKNTFHSFGRAIIWWKNKNLKKNNGHKL